LFVIRDDDGRTALSRLQGLIEQDMNTIWQGLNKPEQFQHSKAGDFFDFAFVSLPHKLYAEEAFLTQVKQLRRRLVDRHEPDSFWKTTYITDIPADGFSEFAKGIWKTIKSNKDLDLPTQKEMLAKYRCDEIAEAVFSWFMKNLIPHQESIQQGIALQQFGITAQALRENSRIRRTSFSLYVGSGYQEAGRSHQQDREGIERVI